MLDLNKADLEGGKSIHVIMSSRYPFSNSEARVYQTC